MRASEENAGHGANGSGDGAASANSATRCSTCASKLAHDQRYCVECGTRRGPLPAVAASIIGLIHEQGRSLAPPLPPVSNPRPSRVLGLPMPDPRAAAVAVMGLLSFGVIVGSLASPTIADLATAPLVILVQAKTASGPAVSAASQTQQPQTITQTVTVGGATTSGGTAGASPSTQGLGSTAYTPTTPGGGGGSPGGLLGLPPVKHVFLIVLTNHGYAQTFSPSSHDHYLSSTLPKQGKVIQFYYSVAPSSLSNEIALISGQGPTKDTVQNCPVFRTLSPGFKGPEGQFVGEGCVYPTGTQTVADQLSAHHYGWRAYVQSIGKTRRGKPLTCRRPSLGSPDRYLAPRRGDPYVTWSNPFVYFRSLTTGTACATNDVSLNQLATDVKDATTAPAFSYIVPSPCDNGSEQPCAPHAPAGLTPADKFLQTVVPEIKRSAAYKDSGVIAITFDQAPQTGPFADPSACCISPTYPNIPSAATTPVGTGTTPTTSAPSATTTTPATRPTTTTTTTTTSTAATPATTTPTTTATTTPTTPTSTGTGQTTPTGGGGQVGLLLISSYVKAGSTDLVDYYNHYSLLGSIENLFGVAHLGYASDASLPVFDASVFNGHP